MSTISDWANKARTAQKSYPYNNQDKQKDLRAIDVIEALLNGEQSAPVAARSIADIYEPSIKAKANVGALWGIISETTRPFDGSATERLVDLMIAIRGLPDITDSAGYPVKYGGKVYWRQLPEWGWIFREHGIEIDPPDDNDVEWYAQAPQLLNATTFAATLLARADFDTGMQFHASHAMREGVERLYDDENREVRHEWRVYLPPAATWILIAGEKLRRLCFEDVAGGMFNPPSAGWPGKAFHPARWGIWKQRFADLASDVEIDERCRGLAARAVEEMGMLERV